MVFVPDVFRIQLYINHIRKKFEGITLAPYITEKWPNTGIQIKTLVHDAFYGCDDCIDADDGGDDAEHDGILLEAVIKQKVKMRCRLWVHFSSTIPQCIHVHPNTDMRCTRPQCSTILHVQHNTNMRCTRPPLCRV